jgi:hypothetical protein
MKRHWRKLAAALVVIIGIIGGYIVYELNFKTYQTSDKEVEKITESKYDITLPEIASQQGEGSSESKIRSSETQPEKSADSVAAEQSETQKNKSDSIEQASTSLKEGNNSDKNVEETKTIHLKSENTRKKKPVKPTAQTIIVQYESVFENLQTQANTKVNHLASLAMNEYLDKKSNEEDISYGYFLNKYRDAAESIEKNTDQTFTVVYHALQKDLKVNGFNPDAADVYKETYEQTKKERKNALMKKALSSLQ